MKTNAYSIEWQMYKYGLSKEEAIEKIKNIKDKIKNAQKNLSDFDHKAMSSKRPEHWIKKGYSEEEAERLAKDQLKYMQHRAVTLRKENPEAYKDKFNTNIEYWLKKGFSQKEAEQKLKERQAVGSLENFKKRYGEEKGKEKWRARQVNWQHTLDNKSTEEKKRINKLKGITLENMIRKYGEVDGTEKFQNWINSKHYFYSPVSQILFNSILKYIKDEQNVKFATHNGEKLIQTKNIIYSYDFFYENKIIEFNGDKFHANPKLYNENDTPNPFNKKLTAKQIWELDGIKIKIAKEKYQVLIIWENDYAKNSNKELKKCLKFLKLLYAKY